MASICPVVGTTTTVLPPSHPPLSSDPEARCPVTNAKVSHHDNVLHSHPAAAQVPIKGADARDATKCPALKNSSSAIIEATCPVVGQVSATLPPQHPDLTESDAGKACPVTNATLEHHQGKLHAHPGVSGNASAEACPVAGQKLSA